MGAVRFSIDSGLVRELRAALPLKVFVETGTYEGDSTHAVLSMFEEVHTVELAPALYAQAAERFRAESKVHVHHGRSQEVLAELAPKLRRRAVLYWLDAHWCDEKSSGEDAQCPLLDELEAIGSISDRSVVMIDDARLFMAPPPKPAVTEGWPQFSEVLERLSALNGEHELLVIDDVIVFFPAQVREPLREYAHHHAVDWLNEMQAGNAIRGRLDRMRNELTALRERTGEQERKRHERVTRKLGALADAISALESDMRGLAEREPGGAGANLDERLAPLATELERTGKRLDSLSGTLDKLNERTQAKLDRLGERTQTNIDRLGERSQVTVERVGKQSEAALEELGKQSAAALERLEQQTQAALEGLQALSPEALDERLGPLTAGLEETGPQLESVFKSLRGLRGRLQQLAQRLDALGETRQELRQLGKQVGPAVEETREGVRELGKQVEKRVEPAVTETRKEVKKLGPAVADTRKEVKQLGKQVEPLGERLESVSGSVEALDERSRQALESLRDLPRARSEINALGERIEALDQRSGESLETLDSELRQLRERTAESLQTLGELPEARTEIAALALRLDAFGTELERLRPRVERDLSLQIRRSEATLEQLKGMRRQMRTLQERLDERERRKRFARVRGFFARGWTRLFGPRLGTLEHHRPRELRIPRRYRRQEAPPQAPPVSVVTQVGEPAPFVSRTIRSVLDQDYEPLELIVAKSAASPAVDRVLERYSERLDHVGEVADGKPGAALNAGFERAGGDILTYLRPDGLLLPGALAYVARYFERHPEVDVVYGHRVLVDGDDKEIGRWVLPRHRDEVLSWADFVPEETLFWRRSIWEAIGGELDDELSEALDWDLLLRFREVGAQMARVPRFLGAVRVPEPGRVTAGRAGVNGNAELARVRERVHGREVSNEEALREVRGYVRRHVVLQKLYRMHLLRY